MTLSITSLEKFKFMILFRPQEPSKGLVLTSFRSLFVHYSVTTLPASDRVSGPHFIVLSAFYKQIYETYSYRTQNKKKKEGKTKMASCSGCQKFVRAPRQLQVSSQAQILDTQQHKIEIYNARGHQGRNGFQST